MNTSSRFDQHDISLKKRKQVVSIIATHLNKWQIAASRRRTAASAVSVILLLASCTRVHAPAQNSPIMNRTIYTNVDIVKQSAEDAILPAMELYSYFALYPLPLDKEQPSPDGTRYKVRDEDLDTMDELRTYLSQVFSPDITQQLLATEVYKEYDGYLYATGEGRIKDPTIQNVTYSILEISDTRITYEALIEYYPGAMVAENPRALYFIREQINGKWLFTTFPYFW